MCTGVDAMHENLCECVYVVTWTKSFLRIELPVSRTKAFVARLFVILDASAGNRACGSYIRPEPQTEASLLLAHLLLDPVSFRLLRPGRNSRTTGKCRTGESSYVTASASVMTTIATAMNHGNALRAMAWNTGKQMNNGI